MGILTDEAPLEPHIGASRNSHVRRVKKSAVHALFTLLLLLITCLPQAAHASVLPQHDAFLKSTASSTVEGQLTRVFSRAEPAASTCRCGEAPLSSGQKAAYGILVPILILLSGLFAGLTLGYMSLDETQLQVLAAQGTPQQRAYANKIVPVRKDGHLLLTTLLIANMITNEVSHFLVILPAYTDALL